MSTDVRLSDHTIVRIGGGKAEVLKSATMLPGRKMTIAELGVWRGWLTPPPAIRLPFWLRVRLWVRERR